MLDSLGEIALVYEKGNVWFPPEASILLSFTQRRKGAKCPGFASFFSPFVKHFPNQYVP